MNKDVKKLWRDVYFAVLEESCKWSEWDGAENDRAKTIADQAVRDYRASIK